MLRSLLNLNQVVNKMMIKSFQSLMYFSFKSSAHFVLFTIYKCVISRWDMGLGLGQGQLFKPKHSLDFHLLLLCY